jgi:hypothetical protein
VINSLHAAGPASTHYYMFLTEIISTLFLLAHLALDYLLLVWEVFPDVCGAHYSGGLWVGGIFNE